MARYTGHKVKQCRREGMNLFFLGQNTSSGKVAILQRRDYPPGVHAQSRRKVTEYGIRLREKQKLKRIFGVYERQFMLYFRKADRLKGNTGEHLLMLLTRRLDNVVLTAGFALTLPQARQLVNHGHFLVNGQRATIPSMQVSPGDVIAPREKEGTRKLISDALDVTKGGQIPAWLEVQPDTMSATMTAVPTRTDFQFPIQEQLIVELCSK